MHRQHLIMSTATLGFTLLISSSITLGQDRRPYPPSWNDPFGNLGSAEPGFPEIPETTPPHTEMERMLQKAQADAQPDYVPKAPMGAPATGEATTVSVAQLRHPLTRRGIKLIKKVQSYLRLGQREKAKEQLAEALQEPSAAPYAHAILGAQYLEDGQPAAAVPELENAASVLAIAGVHSNLGFALCLTGHSAHGRQELAEALRLDGDSARARFLMGVALLDQQSEQKAAEYNLKLAQGRVRSAHLALAVCKIRNGDQAAAEKQVRAYLKPGDEGDFGLVWKWVSNAAANPHPASAFGFGEEGSD